VDYKLLVHRKVEKKLSSSTRSSKKNTRSL